MSTSTSKSNYQAMVMRVIEAMAVPRLVRHACGAVVLERIARGAGATRWFWIGDQDQLPALAARLTPGSSVSFYFDDRLAFRVYGDDVKTQILCISAQDGDAVVGTLGVDGMEVDVEFISSGSELEEYVGDLPAPATVLYGRFPSRDSDGNRVVTLVLPDLDGVVRAHPY